ncbi:hypothetical protein Tco_1419244 [Tanacetum coccineum]
MGVMPFSDALTESHLRSGKPNALPLLNQGSNGRSVTPGMPKAPWTNLGDSASTVRKGANMILFPRIPKYGTLGEKAGRLPTTVHPILVSVESFHGMFRSSSPLLRKKGAAVQPSGACMKESDASSILFPGAAGHPA